jgi:hypothetical protein
MGAGNYLPSVDPNGFYQMVYIAHPDLEWEDEGQARYLWTQWRKQYEADIENLLPGSFYQVYKSGNHNSSILHRNGLLDVCTADNQNSDALFICPREDWNFDSRSDYIPALASRHIDGVAKRLFNGLLDLGYSLSVRCGPWISGKFERI